jgi:hypothetical protein
MVRQKVVLTGNCAAVQPDECRSALVKLAPLKLAFFNWDE